VEVFPRLFQCTRRCPLFGHTLGPIYMSQTTVWTRFVSLYMSQTTVCQCVEAFLDQISHQEPLYGIELEF